jgi:hypothetical protein
LPHYCAHGWLRIVASTLITYFYDFVSFFDKHLVRRLNLAWDKALGVDNRLNSGTPFSHFSKSMLFATSSVASSLSHRSAAVASVYRELFPSELQSLTLFIFNSVPHPIGRGQHLALQDNPLPLFL